MSGARDEDLLDDNFELLLEDSFTITSSDFATPAEVAVPSAPAGPPASDGEPSPFESALSRFYAVYKPENVPRVSQIAAKFERTRLNLWQQLCVKYVLSFRASTKLFMEIADDFMLAELFTAEEDKEAASKQRDFYLAMRADLGGLGRSPEESIERDVNRTHQEMGFFREAGTKSALVNMLQLVTVLNGLSYVQGMHEIAGIIHFATRDEAASFWLLHQVVTELKDFYNPEVDQDEHIGIYACIGQIETSLKRHAHHKLHAHLDKVGFPLTTVLLKYVTTLLATELTIPDTVRLWEVLVFRALKTHTVREMAKALALGFLLLMADSLLECPDLEQLMPTASDFGRSVHFNVDLLIRNAAAVYAFDVVLKHKYTPPHSPSVMATFGHAVEGVLNKVGELLEKLNDDQSTAPN